MWHHYHELKWGNFHSSHYCSQVAIFRPLHWKIFFTVLYGKSTVYFTMKSVCDSHITVIWSLHCKVITSCLQIPKIQKNKVIVIKEGSWWLYSSIQLSKSHHVISLRYYAWTHHNATLMITLKWSYQMTATGESQADFIVASSGFSKSHNFSNFSIELAKWQLLASYWDKLKLSHLSWR